MSKRTFRLAAAAAAFAVTGGSSAWADSGSFTIRVIIPDLTAARQALAEGSAGIWTVDSSSGGLMVQSKDVSGAAASPYVVYGSEKNPFQAELLQTEARTPLAIHSRERIATMNRLSYSIPSSAAGGGQSVSVLISGI